ncbi:hypothetical protein JNK13_01650 [bacterium]|nr:hypothetical protein [bacterium]
MKTKRFIIFCLIALGVVYFGFKRLDTAEAATQICQTSECKERYMKVGLAGVVSGAVAFLAFDLLGEVLLLSLLSSGGSRRSRKSRAKYIASKQRKH